MLIWWRDVTELSPWLENGVTGAAAAGAPGPAAPQVAGKVSTNIGGRGRGRKERKRKRVGWRYEIRRTLAGLGNVIFKTKGMRVILKLMNSRW